MARVDITMVPFPTSHFDVIICSHVLEHIPDDQAAIRELFRVLKPSGYGLIIVPVTTGATIEDPAVVDPRERLLLFGQEDHVRLYGDDFADRLRASGFITESVSVSDVFSPAELETVGVPIQCEPLHVVTKPCPAQVRRKINDNG